MRFSRHAGSNKPWPTSREALAETHFKLPIYRGWPEKPYKVLGTLRFEDPRVEWDEGILKAAISAAKKQNADAIILRRGNESGVSRYTGAPVDTSVWTDNQTTALVIKWKSSDELETEAAEVRALKSKLASVSPENTDSEVLNLAIDYLASQEVPLKSEEAVEKLRDVLASIKRPRDDTYFGKWLCKITTVNNSINSRFTSDSYGIVSVELNGDAMVVVSVSGPELSFSGQYDKGRVSGKLGFGSTAINQCEGVATKEKISLTGQGRTADSLVQANAVLLR